MLLDVDAPGTSHGFGGDAIMCYVKPSILLPTAFFNRGSRPAEASRARQPVQQSPTRGLALGHPLLSALRIVRSVVMTWAGG